MTTSLKGTVLVTRFCQENMMSSYDPNFKWPTEGHVFCFDWDPTPRCGGGLHGWLWGKGDPDAWGHTSSDVMLVVEVLKEDIVSLDGGDKVKFPKGTVVHCGTRESVTQFMKDRGHNGILYGHMEVGNGETAEVGVWGIARAGERGTAVAGAEGTAVAGPSGTAVAGPSGTAVTGERGTAVTGERGRAYAGDGGKAIVGGGGTARVGVGGQAMCTGLYGLLFIDRGDGGHPASKGCPKPGVTYHVGKKGTLVQCRTSAPPTPSSALWRGSQDTPTP